MIYGVIKGSAVNHGGNVSNPSLHRILMHKQQSLEKPMSESGVEV